MSAVYWVLISDGLLGAGIMLPDGLRFVTPPPLPPPDVVTVLHDLPGAHWYRIEDDGAPPELDGCRVELTFRVQDGRPALAGRRPVLS